MKGSLQDQLLGSGLIKKQDANNIKTAKKKKAKQNKANNVVEKSEASRLAEETRLKEQEKSLALNKARKQEAEQKAIVAQIRQMIEINSIQKKDAKTTDDEALSYNFTDTGKIKTIYLSARNHSLVSRGLIAIAKLIEQHDTVYHLIPAEAARKIQERDNGTIVLLNTFEENNSQDLEDDPYAAYEIPDGLMW